MVTKIDPYNLPVEERAISLDLNAARGIVRRRMRSFIIAGIALFLLFLAYGLFLIPQTYTSTVSISVQQNSGTMPILSGLPMLGGGGTSKKYIGVVKSRQIAEEVEKKVGLQKLYDLKTHEDAVEMATKSVVVDDNAADGLLYINITLAGPSPLAFGATERRAEIKHAVRDAANASAAALRNYAVTVDNDRESVLLRAATERLADARKEYDASVNRLAQFVAATRIGPDSPMFAATSPARPGGSGEAPNSATAASVLQALYMDRGRVEADLKALEASQEARLKLVEKQLADPGKLPMEDPLLNGARRYALNARMELQNLTIVYGPKHPQVMDARARLEKAEARLRSESSGIKQGMVTERVNIETQRKSLQTKFEALKGQIANAEHDLQLNRQMATDYETRRNEVTLRLEVLKTTASQSAVLGLQTVSSQSRLMVVDAARLPRFGKPGKLMVAAGSLAGSLFLIGAWLAILIYIQARAPAGL